MDDEAIFHCKHCAAPIGTQNGAALIVGLVRFTYAIWMECLVCKRRVKWRPVLKISLERNAASKDVAQPNAPGVESQADTISC